MKRVGFRVACLAGLRTVAPGGTRAGLSLQIGPEPAPERQDAEFTVPSPPGSGLPSDRQFFDLTFTESAPTENEGLFAYDLAVSVVRPTGVAGGLRLAGAGQPPDAYVFGPPAGAMFEVAESDPDYVVVRVASYNNIVDVTHGKKAARIFFTLDPDTQPGEYRIVFDSGPTVFGSGDPNRPLNIEVDLTDAGVVTVANITQAIPLPAAALPGLAGLGGVAILLVMPALRSQSARLPRP